MPTPCAPDDTWPIRSGGMIDRKPRASPICTDGGLRCFGAATSRWQFLDYIGCQRIRKGRTMSACGPERHLVRRNDPGAIGYERISRRHRKSVARDPHRSSRWLSICAATNAWTLHSITRRGAGCDARSALVAAPRRRAGPRLPGALHQASLMVWEGARRFRVDAVIAVDVVVRVARHRRTGSRPSGAISRYR
jgi:hypothetical protein